VLPAGAGLEKQDILRSPRPVASNSRQWKDKAAASLPHCKAPAALPRVAGEACLLLPRRSAGRLSLSAQQAAEPLWDLNLRGL
jgi:hypothetical protein